MTQDPQDPITHVNRAIQMLQALAVRPDALPNQPVGPPPNPNSIGPEPRGAFPRVVRNAIADTYTRLSQTTAGKVAHVAHEVAGWTPYGAAEQVGHQLANAVATRDPWGGAMALAAIPLIVMPGGSEARMPAQAALRDAEGKIIGVGRDHMAAMDNAVAQGHEYADALDGYTDHTGVVRPGEPIPPSSWIDREEAMRGFAKTNGIEPLGRGIRSEEARQGGGSNIFQMQHEYARAQMNLLRGADEQLSIPEYRRQILGHTLEAPPAIDNAKVASAINAGGTTVHPVTGEKPGAGFWVADPNHTQGGFTRPITSEDVAAFRAKHADALSQPGAHLGGWFNQANQQGEINVSLHHGTLEDALQRGKDWSQHDVGETNAAGEYVKGHDVPLYRDEELALIGSHPLRQTQFESADPFFARNSRSFSALSMTPIGQAHRDWYTDIANAFQPLVHEAPDRFPGLFADLSPQTAPENVGAKIGNWDKAWQLYTDWLKAGKPTADTPEGLTALRDIFNRQPDWLGAANEHNVLRTLSAVPGERRGPKIGDFGAAIEGDTFRPPIDTHMAKPAGVDPAHLGSVDLPKALRLPDQVLPDGTTIPAGEYLPSGQYMSTVGQLRHAARVNTNIDGRLWTPIQTQAAAWARIKFGDVDPASVPNIGHITDATRAAQGLPPFQAPPPVEIHPNPFTADLPVANEVMARAKRGVYDYAWPLALGASTLGAIAAANGQQQR